MSVTSRYSMVIEWSEEDQAFLVTLPEWSGLVNTPTTHGDTYEEAVRNGNEVLELLIESTLEDGDPLPQPKMYAYA